MQGGLGHPKEDKQTHCPGHSARESEKLQFIDSVWYQRSLASIQAWDGHCQRANSSEVTVIIIFSHLLSTAYTFRPAALYSHSLNG